MSQKVSSSQSLKKVLQQQKLYFITLLFALLYLYAGHMWAVEGLPPSMTHAQGGEPVTATVTAILTDTDAARPNIAKFKHIRFTAQPVSYTHLQQAGNGRFSCAGLPHKAHRFTGTDLQVKIVQHDPLRVIAEYYIAEFDFSLKLRTRDRTGHILNFRHQLHHFIKAGKTGHTPDHHLHKYGQTV